MEQQTENKVLGMKEEERGEEVNLERFKEGKEENFEKIQEENECQVSKEDIKNGKIKDDLNKKNVSNCKEVEEKINFEFTTKPASNLSTTKLNEDFVNNSSWNDTYDNRNEETKNKINADDEIIMGQEENGDKNEEVKVQ